MLEPLRTTKAYPFDLAEDYQPVKRSFKNANTGLRTSLTLEKIYWDHLEHWASTMEGLTWVDILYALLSTMPADARNKSSFVRSRIFKFFSSYTISHE